MFFFRRLALHRFVKTHPPSREVSPAPDELVAAYEGILPASLLELWRREGLGFYGALQLALIDPRAWQAVLDAWVASPADTVRRVPIALTPFGKLIYYRRLTPSDEDVAYVDPVSKKAGELGWRLDDFFNQLLCEPDLPEAILPPVLTTAARKACGALATGEVYEVDQMLLSMQMLKIAKVDALEMHRRLRDALDPVAAKAAKPTTVVDALPTTHRRLFEDIDEGSALTGLYLSSYIDWHRLLALRPDGQYCLLFWRIHHQTFERVEVRAYGGTYERSSSADADDLIELDIALRADSSGSDANDQHLVAMHADGSTWLLRADELEDMASAVANDGTMGRSEYYFRRVSLDDAFGVEPSDGRSAPALADLPRALQTLMRAEPVPTTITHVEDPNPDEEEDGEGTVMCTLDRGEDDGLRMNMPLYSPVDSPDDSGRSLKGWVWEMGPRVCKAGIEYRRGVDGQVEHRPVVGDILTTRAPSAR